GIGRVEDHEGRRCLRIARHPGRLLLHAREEHWHTEVSIEERLHQLLALGGVAHFALLAPRRALRPAFLLAIMKIPATWLGSSSSAGPTTPRGACAEPPIRSLTVFASPPPLGRRL